NEFQKLFYFFPRHSQLAACYRNKLVQGLNTYEATACQKRLRLGSAGVVLRHRVDQHVGVEEIFSGHSRLPGPIQIRRVQDEAYDAGVRERVAGRDRGVPQIPTRWQS